MFNFTPINQRTETTPTGFANFGSNVVASNNAYKNTPTPTNPTTPTPQPTTPTPQKSSSEPTGDTPIPSFYAPTPTTSSDTPSEDVDEDKIRRDTLARYQGQIDATKNAYSRLMQDTQLLGQGRLGEGTAQQARGGLLGSDFGQAQTDKTREFNRKGEQDVLLSEAQALAAIMAQAEGDARADIAAKRTAKQYGYEAYKEYNAAEQTRKEANVRKLALSMIRQNVNPTEMGEKLKELAKNYKVSENDIINAYLDTQAEEKEKTGDTEYKTLGADSMLYDPTTGEIITPPGQGPQGPSAYSQERAERTMSAAGSLLEAAKTTPGIFGRSASLPIPSALRTDAYRNFESDLQTLKSNIAFNELTAMREASKTGGALGAVSDKETALLESALGALNMKQSPENFQKNLQQIIESVDRFNQASQQYGGGTTTTEGDTTFAEEW